MNKKTTEIINSRRIKKSVSVATYWRFERLKLFAKLGLDNDTPAAAEFQAPQTSKRRTASVDRNEKPNT